MKKVIASIHEQELAVFWYVPEIDSFIGDRADLSEGIYFGDFGQLDEDHFDSWKTWRIAYQLPKVSYDYYPRGRVMFNSRIHKFVVVCDHYIADNPDLRSSLCYEYGLDKNKVIWKTDEHYNCTMCNKEGNGDELHR